MNKDFIKRLLKSLVSGADTALTTAGQAIQDAGGWLEKNKQANKPYAPQAIQMAQQQASSPPPQRTQEDFMEVARKYREGLSNPTPTPQPMQAPSQPMQQSTTPVYGTEKTRDNSKVASLLDRYAESLSPKDDEFKKVIHAIALDESGGNPMAVGDNGNSIGIFQNNMAGGRGIGHTKENLSKAEYNIKLSVPELYRAFQSGINKGLKGSELTAYVSRVAQRPRAGLEERAGQKYGMRVGG